MVQSAQSRDIYIPGVAATIVDDTRQDLGKRASVAGPPLEIKPHSQRPFPTTSLLKTKRAILGTRRIWFWVVGTGALLFLVIVTTQLARILPVLDVQ